MTIPYSPTFIFGVPKQTRFSAGDAILLCPAETVCHLRLTSAARDDDEYDLRM